MFDKGITGRRFHNQCKGRFQCKGMFQYAFDQGDSFIQKTKKISSCMK